MNKAHQSDNNDIQKQLFLHLEDDNRDGIMFNRNGQKSCDKDDVIETLEAY